MRLLPALFVCVALPLGAAPPSPAELPAALRDWTAWVLHDADHAACPLRVGAPAEDPQSRACLWPGRLALDVAADGARFALVWRSFAPRALPLPGDAEHWPQGVRVDGRPAAVVADANGRPVLWLPAGTWRIDGALAWRERPEQLTLPEAIGWVDLRLDGAAVAVPRRSGERLWLGRGAEPGTGNDSMAVDVYRRLADGVPLRLETRITLTVAGRGREERLGPALPPGFAPIALGGALPARLDADGRLVVQVRPGVHEIVLDARATRTDPALRGSGEGPPWPAQEVWSWAADPRLRVVEVGGAPGIDPARTAMPGAWRELPAFVLDAEAALALQEVSRGLSPLERNRLRLQRQLWLAFDGAGWISRDRISGELVRDWRLDLAAPYLLTQASTPEGGLLVTRGSTPERTGVELRTTSLDLEAGTTIAAGSLLPVTGWDQDFDAVETDLNLPPGWRLIAAPGADLAVGSWASRWDLLDVFLVALTTLLAWWLGRWGLAVPVGVYLVLAWHEPVAPRLALLVVLALALLGRLLPGGGLARLVRGIRIAAVAVLLLLALPFAAEQARLALYPQLERGGVETHGPAARSAAGLEPAPYAQDAMQTAESAPMAAPPAPVAKAPGLERRYEGLKRYAPNTQVQAGTGLPSWTWSSYRLSFSGPVVPAQTVRLVLSPPWLTRSLRIASLLLLGLVLYRLARAAWHRPAGSTARAGALAMIGLLAPGITAAQALPDPDQLDALRARLLQPPACAPACATLAAATLETTAARWRLVLEWHAAADVAAPLPAHAALAPLRVEVDALPRDGLLVQQATPWIELARGVRRVVIDYAVADTDQIDLRFPLAPRRFEVVGSDWRAAGLAGERLLTDTVALTRVRADGAASAGAAQQFAPYVRVVRTLLLDLDWRIETRVERIAPERGAFTVRIPLVPGERVASAGFERVDDALVVALQADQEAQVWQSRLDPSATLDLAAPELERHAEVWRVAAGPTWHVRGSGVPVVRNAGVGAVLEYHPLPGERLRLEVDRPEAIAGPTVAIERVELTSRVGQRAREHTLTLSLRATQGGTHPLGLPDGLEVLGIEIDGRAVNLRPEQGRVGLPLTPGTRRAVIQLREAADLATRVATPAIDLGGAASNLHLQLALPADRWVLATFGPPVGPAVLYWSALLVLVVLAIALARSRRTPLRLHDWLLLALGFSTFSWLALLVVVAWLFALDARARRAPRDPAWFNLVQLALAALTVVALLALVAAIPQGLLGEPDMQIQGNGSGAQSLRWFADRSAGVLPGASAIAVSLWWYKAAMLAWALWLATALLRWLRWGWQAWSEGGYWRQAPPRTAARAAPAPGGTPADAAAREDAAPPAR